MGLFSNKQAKQAENLPKCKLCDKVLTTSEEQSIELCTGHALIMDADIKAATYVIEKYQPLANEATDPETKIRYLTVMLESLYKLKIKYYDHDVQPLEQDIDELIDSVIDCISRARL